MRATRKLDELPRAPKETIGLQIFQKMAVEKNKKEERSIAALGYRPAAISEVAYKIIRADLQAARELYRILVAVALAMVCGNSDRADLAEGSTRVTAIISCPSRSRGLSKTARARRRARPPRTAIVDRVSANRKV
jgi:hypothetical protein